MRLDRRELVAAALPGGVLALAALLACGVFAATLEAAERALLWSQLEARFALLLFVWMILAFALGAAARHVYRHWIAAPARLAEQARVVRGCGGAARAAAARRRRHAGARRRHQRARAAAQRPARRRRRAGARGQPRRRAGTQAPRDADVRAHPERGRVQPRRPHPALQQPRPRPVPCPVEHADARRRRRAARPRPLDLCGLRPRTRGACARGRAATPAARCRTSVDPVRHRHAGRPAAARAARAGARHRDR